MAEPDSTNSSSASTGPRAAKDGDQLLDTFKLAREEELRLLELQRTQLDNMRTRSAQFLAFVGSATAFLAGSGLRAADRDWWFYACAVACTILSAGMIFLGWVLFSNFQLSKLFDSEKRQLGWAWGETSKGHALAYATSQVPPVSAADLAKKLAERYQKARYSNAPLLTIVQKTHLALLAIGSIQLLGWTVLVWTRGG